MVLATLGLAIGGSRVANDSSDLASILSTLGFAILLWLADYCRELSERATVLQASARVTRKVASVDVLDGPVAIRVRVSLVAFLGTQAVAWVQALHLGWPLRN